MSANTNNIITQLKEKGIKVESDSGGLHPLAEAKREMMCLLSDNSLLVINGNEKHMDVMEYQAVLRERKIRVTLRPVGISFIRQAYAELGSEPLKVRRAARNRSDRSVDDGTAVSNSQMDIVRLIQDAVKKNASDIHITTNEETGTISYRVHGDLYQFQEASREFCSRICSTIYMSMCDIAEPTYNEKTHQDARINADFVERCGLFGARIASSPTDTGSTMVIRLLYDSGSSIPSLEDLGYLPEQVDDIDTMRRQTQGINILSGATGSGKSTTLTSVLSSIIKAEAAAGSVPKGLGAERYVGKSVITIEDPPEYKIVGARQTPLVADKTNEESIRQGWQNAIKNCMRQDPDIMMVGEIRDAGSARAAFDAAITGHGVWTTVHVSDATGIMLRLKGLEVESDRMLDPEIITGLINQSLIQKLCAKCSIPWHQAKDRVPEAQRNRIERFCYTDGVKLKGNGCAACSNTGITGRLVIAETIVPDHGFMDAFNDGGKGRAKRYWVEDMKGITKLMSLIRNVNEGRVDPLNAERDVSPFDKDLTTMGIDYSHKGTFEVGKQIVIPKHFHV